MAAGDDSPNVPDEGEPESLEAGGSAEAKAPDAPASWLDDVAPRPEAASPIPAESAEGLDTMLTAMVGLVYSFLTDRTHWDGWAMTPDEERAYNTVFREATKDLKFKHARLATALLTIAALNLMKVARFRAYKKTVSVEMGHLPVRPPGAPA